jgi:UDP-glucose 4-epimerase
MHILVTGGAGYIGSICVEQMLNAGHKITTFDNLTEGHRRGVDPRAELIVGDLQNRCDIEDALEKARPDAVMHFAANALVGESMTNPSKYFRNNVSAGVNLLDAMFAVGCRKFVFSSTCATFGVPERVPIDETTPQNPINPYGESKLMFEKVLRWYDEIHGLKFVALRYFNAAGATERFGEDHRIETHLIPNILKVALGQKPHVEVYGTDYPTPDGTCIRDYIHIIDLAQAHMLAVESLSKIQRAR